MFFKLKKKRLSIFLALVIVICSSVSVFATENILSSWDKKCNHTIYPTIKSGDSRHTHTDDTSIRFMIEDNLGDAGDGGGHHTHTDDCYMQELVPGVIPGTYWTKTRKICGFK